MEIPSTNNAPLTNLVDTRKLFDNYQTGQKLYAKVVEQLPSKNEVIIQLGNKLIQVSSSVATTVGQTIVVEVEKKTNELILKLKREQPSANIVNSTLRQTLPKQLPVHDVLTPLKNLNNTLNQAIKGPSIEGFPKETLKSLSTNINQITTSNINSMVTSKGLRGAILNSGTFFEARVLQSLSEAKAQPINKASVGTEIKQFLSHNSVDTPPLNAHTATTNTGKVTAVDLKANLIKLISLLRSWPGQNNPSLPQKTLAQGQQYSQQNSYAQPKVATQPQAQNTQQNLNIQAQELLVKAEGALAKITLNQLSSASPEPTNRQLLQIEVPFYNGQTVESIFIKIEQESSANKAKNIENQWTVSLEMNPPKLGRIKNKLTLVDNQISSRFWTEQKGTGALIQEHVNLLKQRFNSSDLKTASIDVQTAIEPDFQENASLNTQLSEKA